MKDIINVGASYAWRRYKVMGKSSAAAVKAQSAAWKRQTKLRRWRGEGTGQGSRGAAP